MGALTPGDRSISTHGIGGAADLPLPPELAIAGAVAALAVSFVVLTVAWRVPRYQPTRPGRSLPAGVTALVDSPHFTLVTRALGMVLFLYAAWVAIWGADLLINPFFGMFYVLLWVGLVPASVLLGPAWKALSPVRTLVGGLRRLIAVDGDGLFRYPRRLGYWPAAGGLLAFVWLELVYANSTDLGSVRLWCTVYLAVVLLGGLVFGDEFFERGDPFEVYSTLVAKLSIWGRENGVLVLRSPLANLATLNPRPGLVAVVAVLFGSTAFDSFQDSVPWLQFKNERYDISYLLENVALLAFVVGVGVILTAGAMATGVGPELQRRSLPSQFAHSVVPIVVAYIVAHYLTMFVELGQLTLIQMSDPMSTGADILGTGDLAVNYWLSFHQTLLASFKVVAVIVGHVVGVVAAHDRAIELLPERHQVTGQLSLFVAMVVFTVGGLYLLFAA